MSVWEAKYQRSMECHGKVGPAGYLYLVHQTKTNLDHFAYTYKLVPVLHVIPQTMVVGHFTRSCAVNEEQLRSQAIARSTVASPTEFVKIAFALRRNLETDTDKMQGKLEKVSLCMWLRLLSLQNKVMCRNPSPGEVH